MHFADMSAYEKMENKARWLHAIYHARRTGDVPSLLPLVYGLLMRLLGGNYGAQHRRLKEKWGSQSRPMYIEALRTARRRRRGGRCVNTQRKHYAEKPPQEDYSLDAK